MRDPMVTFGYGLCDVMKSAFIREQVWGFGRFLNAARSRDGVTYFLGNGASASIASTLAFSCLYEAKIKALALTDHNLVLGSSRKDTFDSWMRCAVGKLIQPRDSVVLVSSSGSSANVVSLAASLHDIDVPVFSLTGFQPDNPLRTMSGDALWVASNVYNVVESAHLVLGLLGVRAAALTHGGFQEDFRHCVDEIVGWDWASELPRLHECAESVWTAGEAGRRIIFLGDGSSSSLASHLATDFSKAGLITNSISDHNLISALNNDYASSAWLFEAIERTTIADDVLIFVTDGNLSLAESEALANLVAAGRDVHFHGSQEPGVPIRNTRKLVYRASHPVAELVMPSFGLLAVVESLQQMAATHNCLR